MQLYIHPGSPNARKPRAVVRHLGLTVQECVVDVPCGAHRKPEYLAINPNGKVPTLVDGDRTIWESAAICTHLAWDSALLPSGRDGAVEVVRWVAWNHAHLAPPLGRLVFQRMFAPKPDETAVAEATKDLAKVCAVLDARLTGGRFVLGNALSILDFVLGAEFTYAGPARIALDEHNGIRRWLAALDELPAWRETAPAMPHA